MVRLSSLILEGFSTVPPDFTDVLIVVSSARSSVIFFFRSSGSICLSSRFRRIANCFLFLRFGLSSYLWFGGRCLGWRRLGGLRGRC